MISEQLDKIREEALKQIESSDGLEKLNEIRVNVLEKKVNLQVSLRA
ncbi:phenylalanyl-tRNA synthetase alpha chain PheS [Butyrivibrio hungatei]|uniref:Phenylalanyl-tRNA synthetase alpha chain PheS n=1 Tax=Butyrivibrio hungatei TaxID=185008 RepID=A0A1D9P393_9FIRM|nr:phenylalanyl-tRNA synthetase alpha chain PheS [Butyrivibrio hungatei]